MEYSAAPVKRTVLLTYRYSYVRTNNFHLYLNYRRKYRIEYELKVILLHREVASILLFRSTILQKALDVIVLTISRRFINSSITSTFSPNRAQEIEADKPAGPAPIIMTSFIAFHHLYNDIWMLFTTSNNHIFSTTVKHDRTFA